jgi:hypothetical protein
MKTYDCFPFFNELDILEIRLQELWNSVDYFVISEANMSHSGKPKEFILLDNWERFKPYTDKIKHIKVEDMPDTPDSWMREKFQRHCLTRGLTDIQPEDIIITADCDEIPRGEAIDMIKVDENDYSRYILSIPMFQYKINYMKIFDIAKQPNIMVTKGRAYTHAQQEREYTFPWVQTPEDTVEIDHAGWHFTYFGDDKNAINKIQNFAHTETDTPEMIARHNIEWMTRNKSGHHGPKHPERFEYVVVDDYFPEAITKDLSKWQHMIIPNAAFRVTDLYR